MSKEKLRNLKKKTKGQVQAQALMYVLSVIIMASILIFGYNAYITLIETQEVVAMLQFEKQIESEITKIKGQYESTKYITLSIPGGHKEVCYIDTFTGSFSAATELDVGGSDAHPVVYQSWLSGSKNNLFLIKKITEKALYAGEIKIDYPHYLCINASNGIVKLKLTGGGDHVRLSEG